MNFPRLPLPGSLSLPISSFSSDPTNPDSSPRIQILESDQPDSSPPTISISPALSLSLSSHAAVGSLEVSSHASESQSRPKLSLNLGFPASPSSHIASPASIDSASSSFSSASSSDPAAAESRHRRSNTELLPSKPKLSLRPLVCGDPDSPGRLVATVVEHSNSAASKASKLAYFAQQCTQLEEWLFVAGKNIASSREVLDQHGINEVVNCAGDVCENYFEGAGINYLKFHLLDSASEDIICVLYPIIEFIERARINGRKVLVHCQQGVSRSTVICIAYLMFLHDQDYDECYQNVRQKRGICRPNVGFMCQLLAWRKRIAGITVRPYCLYRLAPHCSRDRTILAKWLDRVDSSALDERAIFILHTPACMYIWAGCQLNDTEIEVLKPVAIQHIQRLQKHEHAPDTIFILKQRDERAQMAPPGPGQEPPPGIANLAESPAESQPHSPRSFSRPSHSGIEPMDDTDESLSPIEGPGEDDPPSLHFWYILGGSPHYLYINKSYDEDYRVGWTDPTRVLLPRSDSGHMLRSFSTPTREPQRSPLPNSTPIKSPSKRPSIESGFTLDLHRPSSSPSMTNGMDESDREESRDQFPVFSPSRGQMDRSADSSESLPQACLYSFAQNGEPEFDLMTSFDSDDLFAESIYFLVFPTLTLEDGPAVEVHFWIGENASLVKATNASGELEAAAQLWLRFLESKLRVDLLTVTPMLLIERQGEETERFWEGFVDG